VSYGTIIALVAVCGVLVWLTVSSRQAGKDRIIAKQHKDGIARAKTVAKIRANVRRGDDGASASELRANWQR